MTSKKTWNSGSKWHRWDVHLHAPGTALSNQFRQNSWKPYFECLRTAEPRTVALGITDYLSIADYVRVREEWGKSALADVRLVFPNIEFRVSPPTKKHKGVNFHLLIDPSTKDHVEQVEAALTRLRFRYRERVFNCDRKGLVSLGRAFDESIQDEQKAYEAGVNEFKVDFSVFREWRDTDPWLKANSLVAVSNKESDGPSGLAKDHGYAATLEEMYRYTDIIFSANPTERAYWLGDRTDSVDTLTEKYGGPKPCLHGSDAHQLEDVLHPDLNRYCWIRAEPTFEGLRQVVFEPRERVLIQEDRPSRARRNWIRAITVENAPWFPSNTIELNEGQIAVIGPRGSGKTALADLLAVGAGAFDHGPASFLRKAGELAHGTEVILEWADDSFSRATVEQPSEDYEAVRYLSQHFVEQLCSGDGASESLLQSIERVVFESLDETDRGDASSFAELRDWMLEGSHGRIQNLQSRISDASKEVSKIQEESAGLPAQNRRLANLDSQLKSIDRDRAKFVVKGKENKVKELEEVRKEVRRLEQAVTAVKKKLLSIQEMRRDLEQHSEWLDHWYEQYERTLLDVGVPEREVEVFKLEFPEEVHQVLGRRERQLEKDRKALSDGPPPSGWKHPLSVLRKEVDRLGKEIGVDEGKERQLRALERRRETILRDKKALEAEIKRVEGADLKGVQTRRLVCYGKVFQEYARQRDALAELYKPLAERLAEAPAERQKLEVVVRQSVDMRGWVERGIRLMDSRRNLWFEDADGLEQVAEELLGAAWRSGDSAAVEAGMKALATRFFDVRGDLAPSVSLQNFANWLFSTDHLSVHYAIRYEGTDIENLSPGTRGIVLLILYLGLDTEDDRPLIIDQPEENLDPQSIFSVLTGYFRETRCRRQVIVVTHNPNLVVNTDADQVIVASSKRSISGSLPKLSYSSGGLEDSDTRRNVCEILEGGEDAFRKREKRYGIHPR